MQFLIRGAVRLRGTQGLLGLLRLAEEVVEPRRQGDVGLVPAVASWLTAVRFAITPLILVHAPLGKLPGWRPSGGGALT